MKEMNQVKKSLGETLCALRKSAGLTQPQVSERLAEQGIDIKTAGISKWEKGQTQPSASQFLALCAIYGVSDVMGEFTDAPTPLSRLSGEGKRLVADYIRVLDKSGLYPAVRRLTQLRTLPLYALAASAGTGQLLEGDGYELVSVGEDVPESADFGVRIAGDSMEPAIPDGSVVWVHRRETLESGRIGVFDYNGQAYCKRLSHRPDGVFLQSLNSAYAPIAVAAGEQLVTFGQVVAVSQPE